MKMAQQLSNIEAILLSIVNEKPSYAYEINKVIDYRNIRMWVRVGVAWGHYSKGLLEYGQKNNNIRKRRSLKFRGGAEHKL